MMPHLTHQPIQLAQLLSEAHAPLSGAIVLFSGEVRRFHKNREVCYLEYEAYEALANNQIGQILAEAQARWNLNHVRCVHRLGKLDISECAVVVLTAAVHRSEAYAANRFIIDSVKQNVPIWKNEFFTDGTSEWGENACMCHQTQA